MYGRRKEQGFTLIEVLVALAIIAVAMAAAIRVAGLMTQSNGLLRDRSMALLAAFKSLNLSPADVKLNVGDSVQIGKLKVKTDEAALMLPQFYKGRDGKPAFAVDSFYDVLTGKIPASKYADKIVIISTHILEEVTAVCTRALVIAHGKRVADETPLQLQSRSRYHQAVTLVSDGALDQAALAALPGVAGVEENANEHSLTVLAQPGQVIFAQVNQLIHARGWQVKELDVERGRLDEVFRSLTRGEVA